MGDAGIKAFGELIEAMRTTRSFINSKGKKQAWTQEELAKRSGLSKRLIGRIERGEPAGVYDDIPALIQAFKLGKEAGEKLYHIAYSPPEENAPPYVDTETIKQVFAKLTYPASARTFLWDFIAFNAYHYEVFNYSPEKIAALKVGDVLGSNLLRVLFDPFFGHAFKLGGQDKWRADIVRNLRIFQSKATIYANTRRFKEIVTEMENYTYFQELWDEAQNSNASESELQLPITRIQISSNKFIEFVSLRMHQYLGEDVDVSVYIPVNSSEEKYHELQASVKNKVKNKILDDVYFFGGQPIR
ncbi:MAG: helix-turn-helix transcriptional regulator [Chloroflexota bacterium]